MNRICGNVKRLGKTKMGGDVTAYPYSLGAVMLRCEVRIYVCTMLSLCYIKGNR